MKKIGVGIYGSNGHQISPEMLDGTKACLVGVCDYNNVDDLDSGVISYDTLEEMLTNEDIHLISICSEMRSRQGGDILKALEAHKHVYAEKPCVMDAAQLDAILKLAEEKGLFFCEMAGSIYERPYNKAREIVDSGVLGDIVQVFAQKSYPYHEGRPQDEEVDGGLIMQCAMYGIRFTEHIAGQRVKSIEAIETSLGNPVKNGSLKMAAALNMKLESGGVATVIANYLNQPSTEVWGNEELRVFGTNGFLTTNIQNSTVRVYTAGDVKVYESKEQKSLFEILIDCISLDKPLPVSPYDLTHPTRMAILAKQSAMSGCHRN